MLLTLRFRQLCWSLIFCLVCAPVGMAAEITAQQDQLREVIRHLEERIAERSVSEGFVCRGERICGISLLPLFYMERGYQPVWIDNDGLTLEGAQLLATLRNSADQGLQPLDYHIDSIDALLSDPGMGKAGPIVESHPAGWADLELLLTDAFLLLASHLSGGRVNPENLHTDWVLADTDLDLLAVLKKAVERNDAALVMEQLLPADAGYNRLRQARSNLVQAVRPGGWTPIPPGPTLVPGDKDDRIELLRKRLILSGDLSRPDRILNLRWFDPEMEMAVQRFQQRHGLKVDGLVGRQTLAALNVPLETRIRQIELNLERWRWLPRDLGQRYLSINTADFKLKAVDEGRTALAMRVVVGRPARRTPVFSTTMSYMVINPYWTVPGTIAREDILPKIKEDETYLSRQGIRVFDGWNEDSPEIDPGTIDWSLYNEAYFPFRLRQDPGPRNALGRMKFIFPNKFAVYLHDTPQRSLFEQVQRDFSSGCIRVEDPLALTAFLFKDDPAWRGENLQQIINRGERMVVRLPEPIFVHIFYMTAWVDEQGILNFREDIYHRDRALDRALRKKNQAKTRLAAD